MSTICRCVPLLRTLIWPFSTPPGPPEALLPFRSAKTHAPAHRSVRLSDSTPCHPEDSALFRGRFPVLLSERFRPHRPTGRPERIPPQDARTPWDPVSSPSHHHDVFSSDSLVAQVRMATA